MVSDIFLCVLDSIKVQDYTDYEIIVVDNASADGSVTLLCERYPDVRLIKNEYQPGICRWMQ